MVASAQIEQRLAFEQQAAPVDPVSRGGRGAPRESIDPDFARDSATQESVGESEPAYSIEISGEAQRIAANDPGTAPQADTRQSLEATVETAATSEIGADDNGGADDGTQTNQVTSFESERAGNDTRNETEAGRTLGQVIDTFA